jgi:hypothetical protein
MAKWVDLPLPGLHDGILSTGCRRLCEMVATSFLTGARTIRTPTRSELPPSVTARARLAFATVLATHAAHLALVTVVARRVAHVVARTALSNALAHTKGLAHA